MSVLVGEVQCPAACACMIEFPLFLPIHPYEVIVRPKPVPPGFQYGSSVYAWCPEEPVNKRERHADSSI